MEYTVALFDPCGTDPALPIRTRKLIADSENDVYDMLGEPDGQTYWEIVDSPRLRCRGKPS
jgi:hypothetical protein